MLDAMVVTCSRLVPLWRGEHNDPVSCHLVALTAGEASGEAAHDADDSVVCPGEIARASESS